MTAQLATIAGHPARTRALLEGLYANLSAEFDEFSAAAVDFGRAEDRDGDEIDAGAAAAHREHQLSLLASVQERRAQVRRAMERLDEGGYGTCESCGEAITKERLKVFPAATSCVACKQAGERR